MTDFFKAGRWGENQKRFLHAGMNCRPIADHCVSATACQHLYPPKVLEKAMTRSISTWQLAGVSGQHILMSFK